jgi:hypothetical protein
MKNKKIPLTKGCTSKIGVKNPNLDGMSAVPKQKMLSPYDVFNKCISRAKNLIECKLMCKDKKEILDDFYRAAVVLSISALDAFIRTTITTLI